MNQSNEQGQQHGYWEYYYQNGQLWYKGNYHNGSRHGCWESYSQNGELHYKGNYHNGERHGHQEWGEEYEFILI